MSKYGITIGRPSVCLYCKTPLHKRRGWQYVDECSNECCDPHGSGDNRRCPECGSELIQRFNKKRQIFYGCSNYPKCTFAANAKPLPQPCPSCGGLLVEYKEGKAKCTKCNYRSKPEDAKEEIKTAVGTAQE